MDDAIVALAPGGEGGQGQPYLAWARDSRHLVVELRDSIPGPRDLYLVDTTPSPPWPAISLTGDVPGGGDVLFGQFYLQP